MRKIKSIIYDYKRKNSGKNYKKKTLVYIDWGSGKEKFLILITTALLLQLMIKRRKKCVYFPIESLFCPIYFNILSTFYSLFSLTPTSKTFRISVLQKSSSLSLIVKC